MPERRISRRLDRITDANSNRAAEGLRAVEDVFRFVLDRSGQSRGVRDVRHGLTRIVRRLSSRAELLRARDSVRDVGARRWREGIKRAGLADMVTANFKRAQESIRVLEEIARVKGKSAASRGLQALRFRLYALEKEALGFVSGARSRSGGRKRSWRS